MNWFNRRLSSARLLFSFAAICLCSSTLAQQPQAPRDPHLGYVYPAGAKQGAKVQVMIGGQALRGATDVHVSGSGVRASVVRWIAPIRPLNGQQMQQLQRYVRAARDGRTPEPLVFADPDDRRTSRTTLPDHPIFREAEKMSPEKLEYALKNVFSPKRRQMNQQIAETVLVDLAVDAGAPAGDRELRLITPNGLSNPIVFQVGQVNEVRESEPNNPDGPQDTRVFDVPVTLNGQVMPGDVDRFRFRARAGQKLVVRADARHLIPYLADAVPGWFQATLAVYDSEGRELAFADDYRFNPDPVLLFQPPADGEYQVEIRDSIYRGREDFVYRVTVAEQPFITAMYPMGGRAGAPATAWLDGWNLPWDRVQLQTSPGALIRNAQLFGEIASNLVNYVVDAFPESVEVEPNEKARRDHPLALPHVINGMINKPGDLDAFAFRGRAGEKIVAEIQARRLGSPMDSLLRLYDESGALLGSNDDNPDREFGLITHHADSKLTATLPSDGVYVIEVSDAQNQGGPANAYRLRVGPPQPDFALRVTPSSVNLGAGQTAVVTVFALRKDGFDGDIDVVLAQGARDFMLGGARIPAGRDRVRMTITANGPLARPVPLRLDGQANINGARVVRPVVPAEDMMQAFAYTHLVPTQTLLVAGKMQSRWGAPVQLASNGQVRVPRNGSAQVHVKTPRRAMLLDLKLEIDDPPKGVSVKDVKAVPGGMTFSVSASGEAAATVDNLIVEAFASMPSTPLIRGQRQIRQAAAVPGGNKNGKAAETKRKVSLGVLPAIPFQIVEQ
jgi:hypothetical protein